MLIFIDTNVFYKNWHLTNANFTLLFNFISNDSETLLISKIVIDEVESNREKYRQQSLSELKKVLKNLDAIVPIPMTFDLSALEQPYSFKKVLEENLDPTNIVYIDYDSISHKEVVKRAIRRKRPFKEGEKGYRDTLIWLSLLDYLVKKNIKEDVVFITENSDDFLNSNKTDLHEDLLQDIDNLKLGCKIISCLSLYKFNEQYVDKDIHALNHSEIDDADIDIEYDTMSALNSLSIAELKSLLAKHHRELSTLTSIVGFKFDFTDGMEDGTIESSKHIDGNIVHVDYAYNLRRCYLEITISRDEFAMKSSQWSEPFNVLDEGIEGITIEIYTRIYLSASFNYNITTKSINGLIINATVLS